jgi:hypothetical protein
MFQNSKSDSLTFSDLPNLSINNTIVGSLKMNDHFFLGEKKSQHRNIDY